MSLKLKSIIAGALVILVLVVLLLMLLEQPEGTSNNIIDDISQMVTNSSSNNPLTLIDKQSNMIDKITIKNKSDEFVIEKLEEDTWGIKELNNFNLITNYSTILKTVSSFTAIEIVEEDATDLEMFGFDTPNIIIDVEFNDMKTYQIKVGDISSQTNTAYVIIDDNPTVYRMLPSTFSDFLLSRKAFISTNIIPALPTYDYGTADPDFTYMKLEREDLKEPWEFEKYESKTGIMLSLPVYLQFSSPVECDVDAERFPKYFENYFGLSALSIEAFNPTVEQLEEYGFNSPHAKFTTIYGGGEMEFTLIVGDKISTEGFNSRYLMLEGTDLVYVIETNNLPFLTVNSSDFLSSMLVLESLYGFSKIEVTVDGKKNTFDIWEEDDVIVQNTENSYEYADGVLLVNLNDNSFDTDIYKQYIQTLFLTSVNDVTDKKPSGTPTISIKYTYLDESIETVDVYEQADRTTIIVLNNKDYFVGRTGYVDSVRQQTEYLLNG